MVEAIGSYRGVPMDAPIHDDGSVLVQPVGPSQSDEIIVHDGENVVGTTVPQLQQILDEGSAEFARHSYSGHVDGDDIVLEAYNGKSVTIEDARAFVEALRDAE